TKRTLCLAGAVLLVLVGPALADQPAKEKKFLFNLLLSRGDPLGSREAGTIEDLSRPTMTANEKQQSWTWIVQQVMVAGKSVDVGPKMEVFAESTPSGKIRVRVAVEVTEVLENGETQSSIHTERSLHVREVKAGELVRLRVGKRSKQQTWLE